ncbi:MAG: hypothetical protein CMH63_02555 [Nanoarchaeota archaeon]|jgi:hypothetical protein|nr:hypothetical protein [Nanoarchaeota archaeon]|tara:strand:- start:8878 stop:9213 length:336 start_codon:yes stop_codon:yes gene_type:complete
MDSSKVVKAVLLITVAVLFLVTSIISLVSASNIISETAKTYILKVERCEFEPLARSLESGVQPEELPDPERGCKIDYNQTKRELADSIAMLIIALPIALFTYRKLFKIYKD